jgi:uncharacterized protein (DUF433 family)
MQTDVVNIDPEILGGTPVFRGTRVSIENLFDYLKGGETLYEFLDQFPAVNREQAIAVLQIAEKLLTSGKLENIETIA